MRAAPAGLRLRRGLPAVLVAVACSGHPEGDTPLPQSVQGLELVAVTSGAAAEAALERLHGKDVAPTESHIGHYGTGVLRAVLYVSRFDDRRRADAQLGAMSERIGAGSSGFGHHRRFSVSDRDVRSLLGQGQVHFLFVTRNDLVWLAVAPPLARAALAELLEVPVDAVPPMDSLVGGT